MARQPDNVRPKEAEVMYKEYLFNMLGNAKNVWFKEHSETEEMRSKYDPIRIEESLKVREAEAKASVGEFMSISGSAAALQEASTGAPGPDVKHPEVAWHPDREAKDLELLKKLVSKLDQEKNIQKNPLFGETDPAIDSSLMVDAMLLYLWKVHGVDYFGCKELRFNDFRLRKDGGYTGRGAKPEALDPRGTEEGEKFFKDLELKWDTRVFEGDQAFKLVGKEKLEAETCEYVDSQVQCIDGNKFMCKLCTKLFKGADFTKKHISNKHGEIVDQIKAKIVQKIYLDNFLADETFTEHEREYKELQASLEGGQPAMLSPGAEARRNLPRPPTRPSRRAYTDLDQPKQESRSVLDYGDI